MLIAGAPAVTVGGPWLTSGCPGAFAQTQSMTGASVPVVLAVCITGVFHTGATRVRASGQPLLLQESLGMSVPSAQPLLVLNAGQTRVRAT